jgi:hypothetical protein
MRVVLFISLLVALTFAGYVAISGFFLANLADGILTVGRLSSVLAAAKPPEDPLALGYRGNPMQALSLPFEVRSIDTPLGKTEAWYVPASGIETGKAIYVHGIAGAREDGYRHLSILHEAGWSVLLISYRNDAGAPAGPEGRYGFGLLEWPDLEAAVSLLAPGPDGPGLLVVAESMGGAVLGQFLAQSHLADRVKAVALDSPSLSFGAVIEHLAVQGGKPLPGATAWAAKLILPRLTDLPLQQAEVGAMYSAFPGPLFIAHGSADRIVPVGPSQALAEARTAATIPLWTEADHLQSYAEDPAAYRAAFKRFLASVAD